MASQLPQHIVADVGGTVALDLLTRPSTAPTLSIYTGAGTEVASGKTSTLLSVNTTLATTAPARGDKSITVAAADNIAAGQVLWIGGDREAILVRAVSGTTIFLRRPLLKAHAIGDAVEGTRCTYAVQAADAGTKFWAGRIKWMVDGVPKYQAVECTLYPLDRFSSVQNLFDRHPRLYEVLDPEVDAERLLDAGHEDVLRQLGTEGRARAFTAGPEFITADVVSALKLHYEHDPSEHGTRLWERYGAELENLILTLAPQLPRDTDQDGIAEVSEQVAGRSYKLRM